MSGIYGVLDQAIAFGNKLQKDEHSASFVRCLITKDKVKNYIIPPMPPISGAAAAESD
jgi:hypothetical protein